MSERRWHWRALLRVIPILLATSAHAESGVPFAARRRALMDKIPDGIVLLHSGSSMKRWEDAGARQDPSFFYFTGLANLRSSILAVDGRKKESWLFVPVLAPGMRPDVPDLTGASIPFVDPGDSTARALGIDHVVAWDHFISYIDSSMATSPKPILYLDDGGQVGRFLGSFSNPQGLLPVENPYVLWATAIKTKWPDAVIGNA